MGTNHQLIEREKALSDIVHAIELATRLISAGEPGLVSGADKNKPCLFETEERFFGVFLHLEFFKGKGGDLMLRSRSDLVQYSIPFNKDGSLHTCQKA